MPPNHSSTVHPRVLRFMNWLSSCALAQHSVTRTKNFSTHARPAPITTRTRPAASSSTRPSNAGTRNPRGSTRPTQDSNMHGRGYDGASNMSGKYRGVQARVKELYPLAMYTHCCNHVLNLVISTSSQLPVIRNAVATISDICVFLSRSAQRVSIFQDHVERSFRLGFFATEAETNLRHTLGRKTWRDHHFRDTIASSCFYTWGIAAGKQASGGCDQGRIYAQAK